MYKQFLSILIHVQDRGAYEGRTLLWMRTECYGKSRPASWKSMALGLGEEGDRPDLRGWDERSTLPEES